MTKKNQHHTHSTDPLKVFNAKNLTAVENVKHGFFSRIGGVSKGIYATLNCGYSSKDQRENVAQNRHIVANELGSTFDRLITCKQSHTNICHIIDENVIDENNFFQKTPYADAMVTKLPNVAIAVLSADCATILLADKKKSIIGVAHAGWRGALKGVIHQTIKAMQKIGSDKKDIVTALGPVICHSCYEITLEFYNEFIRKDPLNKQFFKKGKDQIHMQFNLSQYIESQMQKHNLKIEKINLCTYENPHLFFSHRYNIHKNNTNYGRQIAAIMIKNEN